MRRKWQLFGVLAALGAAASVTLVFTIGAGASGDPSRAAGTPGAGTAAPTTGEVVEIGRVQPRKFLRTDYQTGGTGLRNQAEGGITINGVAGPPVTAFLWWAVITSGPAVPGTYDTIRLQRLFPAPQVSTTAAGTIVGVGASPCWPGDTITVYERVVTTAVAGVNGFYRVTFPFGVGGASTAGQDPWDGSAAPPELEGASLAILYQAPGDTFVYSKANAGGPPLSGNTVADETGFTYGLAIPAAPAGGTAKFDEIGADGQTGSSRTAFAGTSSETTAINGTLVAGPGSPYNDSDWNGSDSRPLPQLWDTHGHDITGLVPAGSTTIKVDISAPFDCLTTVANLVHFGP